MFLTHRSLNNDTDLLQMIDVARRFPVGQVHIVDLPYRLCSWALDDPDNAQLWFDGERVAGWALLNTPFWTIDFWVHSELETSLLPEMLAWAERRARAIKETAFGHPVWFVKVFEDQPERIRLVESQGFANQFNVGEDSWSQVWMVLQAGKAEESRSSLPEIRLRPLAGKAEVDKYVDLHRAVFQSKNMTREWRSRTLGRPEYHAELDCVAATPEGDFAAFCIGWLAEVGDHRETWGQIEPMGVSEALRGKGLGKALLSEVIRRMRASGAVKILVETDNDRSGALALYQSVGFKIEKTIFMFRKEI